MWEADPSLIQAPTMLLSSTGVFDAAVASMESLQTVYDNIPDDVAKVLAKRTGGDHGKMLYCGDCYVTAWFLYWLKNDADAGKAFFGENAEIVSNGNWQDVRISK